MADRQTTLILGAGASSEVGLPVGRQLKDEIAHSLDIRYDDWGSKRISGSVEINDAFRIIVQQNNVRDIKPFLRASWRIRDACLRLYQLTISWTLMPVIQN